MQGSGETYPRGAYLLSLIGGILLLLFSLFYIVILISLASIFANYGFGLAGGVLVALGAVALILGVLVLVFALKLKSSPGSAKTYGILILVLALISFVGGGGFYIGAILALIGGILAIIWHPPASAAPAWGQAPMAPPVSPPASPPPS